MSGRIDLGVLVAALTAALALSPAAAAPQAAAMDARAQIAAAPSATITNGLITATVLLPEGDEAFYRGTRFDRAGVISALAYKDRQFYGPWFSRISGEVRDFAYDGDDIVAGPNTAMVGPADEFDFDTPQGWAEAAPGGVFVKIGVGLLRRPDDAKYSPFRTYDVVDPGHRTVKIGKDAVTFTHTLAEPTTGYGYVYAKTLRLPKGQPRLLIVHSLRNTSTKPIVTTVYNHNFLTFGAATLGEGLSITTPFQIASSRPPSAEGAAIRGQSIAYLKTLRDKDRVTSSIEGFGPTAADNSATVHDEGRRAGVTFHGDHPLSKLQLWSIRSVVAVEPFITLVVAPGQEAHWTYAYDYVAG
ncbi:MAG: hypothetical protein JWQ46_452 [Phenylobacterium sp.]|nr:hypothetical protein [Phenylobacterium sp.]